MSQLFRLYDVQQYDGGELGLNRYWFYNPSGNNVTALAVAQAFEDQWMDTIRAAQSQEIDHTEVFCEEMLGGIDSAQLTVVAGVGNRGGDCQPSFTQWSYYLKPTGPTLKKGGKRFMGVSEDDTNSNNPTGGVGNALENLRQILLTGLAVATENLVHAIVRYVIDGQTGTYTISPVVGSAFRAISTQRSRLAGNGSLSVPFFALSSGSQTATDISAFTDPQLEALVTSQQSATWSVSSATEVTETVAL